ncbi:serine hydrolase domain-containing protein [Steroidobacter flavus]|uniref:Serine hydrolase domain-containing protein n=1 Tax=Steroidobacter flavus TaxID=1842136 RepID=A0ABV8T027_9GAMM
MRAKISLRGSALTLLGLSVSAVSLADADIDIAIDKVFSSQDSTRGPGCAVGVMRKGEIVFQRGYGMADLEQKVPVTPRTAFSIASISKQFTATAIALLEEQGKVSADDDVRKYVPELRDYGHVIRIRHLIHHTSGLRDYSNLWGLSGRNRSAPITRGEALDLLARQKQLNFVPGEQYSYNNSGYLLLEVIVERVSGLSLGEFAAQYIFRPLGMRHTLYYYGDRTATPSNDDTVPIIENRAQPYLKTASGEYRLVRTSYDSIGAGGVITTLEDLARWDANFYDNRLGKGGPALIERLTRLRPLNGGQEGTYGYGLMIEQYRGVPTVFHSGGAGGYSAFLQRFPNQQLSVAVLCNEGRLTVGKLTRSTANVFLGEQLPVPAAEELPDSTLADMMKRVNAAGPPDSKTMSEYVGEYFSNELDTTFRVAVKDGKLLVTAGYAPPREPKRFAPDQFFYDGVNRLTFKRDGRGRVTGLQFNAERIRSLDAPKR